MEVRKCSFVFISPAHMETPKESHLSAFASITYPTHHQSIQGKGKQNINMFCFLQYSIVLNTTFYFLDVAEPNLDNKLDGSKHSPTMY